MKKQTRLIKLSEKIDQHNKIQQEKNNILKV